MWDEEDGYTIVTNVHPDIKHVVYLDFLSYSGEPREEIDLTRHAAKECDGCLLAYIVRNREGFEYCADLYRDVLQKRQKASPVWVVANGIDMEEDRWQTSLQEGREFADSIGAEGFLPTSAKTGEGCGSEVVSGIAARTLLHRIRTQPEEEEEPK